MTKIVKDYPTTRIPLVITWLSACQVVSTVAQSITFWYPILVGFDIADRSRRRTIANYFSTCSVWWGLSAILLGVIIVVCSSNGRKFASPYVFATSSSLMMIFVPNY